MSGILILGDARHPALVGESVDLIVPLFWTAPETLTTLEQRWGCPAVSLSELVPDVSVIARESYDRGHAIATASPKYRGVLPLLGHETVLADLLSPNIVAAQVVEGLAALAGDGELITSAGGSWAGAFQEAARSRGSAFRVRDIAKGKVRDTGLASRIVRAGLDAVAERDWRRLVAQPIEHVGPRFRRSRTTQVPKDRTWCYASYVNYARALARHAIPGAAWLVNGRSGASGVPAGVSPAHLWDMEHPRSRAEHLAAAEEIVTFVAGRWPSREVPDFTSMILGVLAEIDLFRAFVERAEPVALWVGNQWGGERTLIQVAREADIPVIQVQHGALESHFRWADLATDRFLVWGEAWRSRLPEASQARTEVVDPGVSLVQSGSRAAGGEVVFLSAPTVQPLWDPQVARHEAAQVLAGVARSGTKIVARIHPMDDLRPWRASLTAAGAAPERFDKGVPLETSLAGSTAALTYRSTVFMDCVASGIPVVALGWYPWVWDDAVREFGGMTLAGSIAGATVACLSAPNTLPDITPWLAGSRQGQGSA
jgi:hypothetical protein